jgi:hypothetical protein
MITSVCFIYPIPPEVLPGIARALNEFKETYTAFTEIQKTEDFMDLTITPAEALTYWLGTVISIECGMEFLNEENAVPFGAEAFVFNLVDVYGNLIRKNITIPKNFPKCFTVKVLDKTTIAVKGFLDETIHRTYRLADTGDYLSGYIETPAG